MVLIMRFITILLSFSVAALAHAEAPESASSGLAKVEFVQAIAAEGTKKLLGHDGSRFYMAKSDGSVKVISLGKGEQAAFVLPAKDRKGESILKHPEAAVASGDIIYVVDSELNRVVMFTADGKYKASFGSKGSNAGELRAPQGIAFHDGIIYVADSGNGRIQMFGDNGVFLDTLEIDRVPANKAAKEKKLPYQLSKPMAITLDPTGRVIYVLDAEGSLFSSSTSIKAYGPDGTFLRQFPQNGKPVAISAVPDGLYAADQDGYAIQKYDLNGKLASSFGSKGEGRAQFKSMDGLVADNGQVYLGDSVRGVIFDFRTNAAPPSALEPRQTSRAFVRWTETIQAPVSKMAWNGKDTLYGIAKDGGAIIRIRNGVAEGELKLKTKEIFPVAVTVDNSGALWVLDKKKMQVVKLDASGNTLAVFGMEGSKNGQFDDPTDIAISSTGIIFIADTGNHRVQAFSDDGVLLSIIGSGISGKLRKPSAIAIDPQDNLYVLDTDRSTVSAYSAKGEALAEFGQDKVEESNSLKEPHGLMATRDEVFVAESNRIKVYSHEGKYIRSFGAEGKGNGEFKGAVAIAEKDATNFFIAEQDNKRIQAFNTLYKPNPPLQVTAQGGTHAIELRWAASPLPYVAQYQIYRSKNENAVFVRISASKANQFSDQGLPPEEKYYYKVTAETEAGYEGLASPAVNGTTQKYSPPPPENIQAASTALQLKMTWNPLDSRYISAYLIYRKDGDAYTKVGETVAPEFTKDGLTPGTEYTFYIAARSVDGIESEKTVAHATTSVDTETPLDVNVVELHNVFSNTYKLYEQDGIGTVKLTNNTSSTQKNIKVSFVLNNFMDYPTETKINSLAPGESKEIPLKAVFNNNILTLTEDTPVQANVEASYYENGQKKVFSSIKTVNIFDKHRLMWNEPGRFAAFVTPKDPLLVNFVRSVATEFSGFKDAPQLAATVFDTLGALGLTYAQKPTNPYQISSAKVDYVDYVQYPRDTLKLKSGDCDALTALYSASLEGLGIPTRVVLVPGHMFMMFSTGIDVDQDNYTMNNMYVIHEGTLWIPVETTLVGKSFAKAWEEGSAGYYKWKDKGLEIFDPHQAWEKYKPATLPEDTWKSANETRGDIDKAFPGDLKSILKISSQTKTRRYLHAIQKNPSDMAAHLQIGIILAKTGDRDEAMKYFKKVIESEPNNAAALNNEGNLFMLDAQYSNAQKLYIEASKADPKDPEILVNLANSYKAANNVAKAKEAFVKAQQMDPSMADKHKALSLELLNTLSDGNLKPKRSKTKKTKEPT